MKIFRLLGLFIAFVPSVAFAQMSGADMYNPASSTTSGSGVSSFSGDGALITNSGSTGAVTATLGTTANLTLNSLVVTTTESAASLTTTTLTVLGNASLSGTTTVANLAVNAFAAPQTALTALVGEPPIYLASQGAKFNAIFKKDLTTTNGSANVSSASYSFTSADVGKDFSIYAGLNVSTTGTTASGSNIMSSMTTTANIMIYDGIVASGVPAGTYVQGVGPGSQIIMSNEATASHASEQTVFAHALNTTITAISGTSAVLANTTSTSGSSVMRGTFGTDDTNAINSTLTGSVCSGANGCTLQMPLGTTMITGSLQWGPNISIAGQGELNGSKIYWASPLAMTVTVNPAVFLMPSGSSYATPNTNNTFTNFELDMNTATHSLYADGNCLGAVGGGNGSFMQNGYVDHVYTHGSPATCWGIGPAQNFGVRNSLAAHDARLSNSNAANGGGELGVALGEYTNIYESFFYENNIVYDPGTFVILDLPGVGNLSNSGTDTAVISNNLIYYDSFSPSASSGWAIQDGGLWGASITGNTIIAPPAPTGQTQWVGIGTGCGDYVNGLTCSTEGSVGFGQNGVISGNSVSGLSTQYLLEGSLTKNYKVTGNVAYGGGTSSGVSSCFIVYPQAASQYNIDISNNLGVNCGLSGFREVGTGSTEYNLSLTNNKFVDYGGGVSATTEQQSAFSFGASSTTIGLTLKNNIGLDDGAGTAKQGLYVDSSATITNADIGPNNFFGVTTSQYVISGTVSGPNDTRNTSQGAASLAKITTGSYNTIYGSQAGALITTGTGNIEIGYNTDGTVGTIGSGNILIGNSLALSTSATNNTGNIGNIVTWTGAGTPSTSIVTIAGGLVVTGTCTNCGSGAAFTPVLQPISITTTDTAGNAFPYTYFDGTTTGAAAIGAPAWGVAASLGADTSIRFRFLMPPTLPASGTLNLCSLCQANATSGVVKYTVSDADIATNNTASVGATVLNSETQTSITWSNADDYVRTCTALTETPTANHVSAGAVTFNHTSWTLAQILSCNWTENWQ